jgi:ABC-type glycerol-3-phosphate transport system substrate-binding protein
MIEKKGSLSRRDFLRMSALTAAGAALAACQPQVVKETVEVPVKETVVVEGEKVEVEVEKVVTATPPTALEAEVTVMVEDDSGYAIAFDSQFVPYFNKDYPGITLRFTPEVSGEKKLAAMVAGDAPDIIGGCCGQHADYAQRGQLLDVKPLIDTDWPQEKVDDFNPGQFNSFFHPEYGQYALPYFLGVVAMYFNKDMFDEEGVEYPPQNWEDAWTYEKYTEVMQRFVKQDASGKQVRWGGYGLRTQIDRVGMHVKNFGGHFTDETGTRCLLGEPEAQEALWWLYDRTWTDNSYAVATDIQDGNARAYAFPNRMIAMMEEGTWSLDNVAEAIIEFNWDVAVVPKGPVAQTTMASNDGVGIWSGTKNVEATWAVMSAMMDPFYFGLMARVQLYVPPRKSLLDGWYETVKLRYEVLEPITVEVFGEAIKQDLTYPMEIFAKQGPAEQILTPALERVYLVGTDTPDIFKNGVCAEVEAAMKE